MTGRCWRPVQHEDRRAATPGVDHDRGTLMIRQSKGKKDRMVPVGERALAWIEKHRDEVRRDLALAREDDTLFPDERRDAVLG